MFGSDTAVIARVLQTFLAGAHGNIDELTHAVATQDLTTVASVAHKITGACRMSGALAMGEVARTLERAAKQGDACALQRQLDELNTQWRLLQRAIGTEQAE